MARAELIAKLKKRFSKVVSKRGSTLLGLWGEVGVGQSWLIKQLLSEIPCQNIKTLSTESIAELIQQLPQPNRLPLWAENSLVRISVNESVDTLTIVDTLGTLLAALAPFILYVEDLHKASSERLTLWTKLAKTIENSRGIGIITSGYIEPLEGFEPYRLEPLTAAETAQLIDTEAQGALPIAAHTWVYERSQGNPLFSLEYFRYLTRLGHLWSDGQRWRWRPPANEFMPTSIEALIVQLLHNATNSSEVQITLAAKALLPSDTLDHLWAEITELKPKEFQAARAQLESQGILIANKFAHSLMQEVAQRELSQIQLSQLAQRAINLLRIDKPREAAFFVEKAELSPQEAQKLLERAAKVAKASGNELEMADFLARAASFAKGSEQVNLALEAARLLRGTNLSEASEMTQLALKANPNNVEAILLQASLLSSLGQGAEAEQLLQSLSAEKRSEADWLEALIAVRVNRYDYGGAWELWQQHPEIHSLAAISTYVHIGRSLTQLGMLTEAKAFFKDAMNIPNISPLEQASLLSSYAIIPLTEGNFTVALNSFNAALETYSSVMLYSSIYNAIQQEYATSLSNRSLVLYRLGHFRKAIADLEEYLQIVGKQGNGRKYTEGQVNLGTYLIEVGEFERAEELLMESREVLERNNNTRWLVVVEQALVQLYLDWAPTYGAALALRHASAAEIHARRAQSPPQLVEALYFISRAEAEHGQAEKALELVKEMQTVAADLGEAHLEAVGIWVRGLALEKLGQQALALENLNNAVDNMKNLDHEPFSHRLALEIDRIKGDAATAATRITHFERVDNLNWVNITYRYFPELAEVPKANKTNSPIYLRVLGPIQIELNGSLFNYKAQRGKFLLALLLEARIAGRSEVSQLDLLDSLYPDMDEKRATSALKQLIYRLRSGLGSATIARTSNGYALGDVNSDAEDFLNLGDVSLWRGPYLQDLEESWSSSTSDALYHELRLQVKKLKDKPQEAVNLSELLLKSHPYELEVLVFCLGVLQVTNNKTTIDRVYQQSCKQFAEVGEQLPENWEDLL